MPGGVGTADAQETAVKDAIKYLVDASYIRMSVPRGASRNDFRGWIVHLLRGASNVGLMNASSSVARELRRLRAAANRGVTAGGLAQHHRRH
eukprot:5572510-Karenia_brevis.AAC.1